MSKRPAPHAPGYLREQLTKTYAVGVICANCGERFTTGIEKGLRVDEVLPDVTCPTCGCVGTLEKR